MTLHIIKKAGIKLNIRVYYDVMKDIVIKVIISLSAVAIVLFAACLILELQYTRHYIEAGEELKASDIFAMGDDARFGKDFDPECLNEAGVHYFTVITKNGERRVRLRVMDTKAPEVKVKDIKVGIGGELPRPEDFIDEVYEPGGFKGEYVSVPDNTDRIGFYNVKIRFTDASGNKTGVFTVKFERVLDNESPVIEVESPIIIERGGSVDYSAYVTISDNCAGELRLEFDESDLDTGTVGDYTVYVIGIDAIGNKSEREAIEVSVVESLEPEAETCDDN